MLRRLLASAPIGTTGATRKIHMTFTKPHAAIDHRNLHGDASEKVAEEVWENYVLL
jgi:hypothetical protein